VWLALVRGVTLPAVTVAMNWLVGLSADSNQSVPVVFEVLIILGGLATLGGVILFPVGVMVFLFGEWLRARRP